MTKLTFEYGTPFLAECYGGIETIFCEENAVWTEYEEDNPHYIALVCDRCKKERETYINNVNLRVCNHQFEELPGEPPVDICIHCGEVRQ
jgi:hypothetical protein